MHCRIGTHYCISKTTLHFHFQEAKLECWEIHSANGRRYLPKYQGPLRQGNDNDKAVL
jgi:hypothetical protein